MDKFQNTYRIPSARADWHGYGGGVYFVTICTQNREHYFGEIMRECYGDGVRYRGMQTKMTEPRMHLSEIGQYAQEQFMNVEVHYPYARIPLFVVMPNHVHAIVIIDGDKSIENDIQESNGRANGDGARCGDGVGHGDGARHGGVVGYGDVARNVSTVRDCPSKNLAMADISPQKKSLAVVIRGIKSSITKFANQNDIQFAWQSRFHDRIVRGRYELECIADYIESNVANWQNDDLNKL